MNELGFHLISVVWAILESGRDDLTLEFSRYRYLPQSVFDERHTFFVPISDVTQNWLDCECSRLQESWELAINSRVRDGRGRTFHIPMIDFVGRNVRALSSPRFMEVVGRNVAKSFEYFDSGRSFHAYSGRLMTGGEWVKFMGRLLLLNFPNEEPVVDARWIGHRLLGGYSSLRWSRNSEHYLMEPQAVQAVRLE